MCSSDLFKFKFKRLEDCFESYGEVVGFLSAITIVQSTVTFFSEIFKSVDLLDDKDVDEVMFSIEMCRLVEEVLNLVQLGYMGQYIKDQVST